MTHEQIENLKALTAQIAQWGEEKQLNDHVKQHIKLHEEAGELAEAILKNDQTKIADGIGDCYVVAVQIQRIIAFKHMNDRMETGCNLNHEVEHLGDALDDICANMFTHRINALIYIAKHYELDFVKCVQNVYNIISKRKGKTVDNVFEKEED